MNHFKSGDNHVLIFQKGERFIEALTGFCADNGISAGFFHGLGGALSAEIGYYHLDSQEYEFTELNEVLEIVSLHGNVALKDDRPFIHAHGVFSDAKLRTYGGHVKEFVVGGTCELQLQAYNTSRQRVHDEATGLDLIDPDS